MTRHAPDNGRITWRLHSRKVEFRLFVRFRKFICFLVEAEGLQSGGMEAAGVESGGVEATGGVKSGEVEGESLLLFTLSIFLILFS